MGRLVPGGRVLAGVDQRGVQLGGDRAEHRLLAVVERHRVGEAEPQHAERRGVRADRALQHRAGHPRRRLRRPGRRSRRPARRRAPAGRRPARSRRRRRRTAGSPRRPPGPARPARPGRPSPGSPPAGPARTPAPPGPAHPAQVGLPQRQQQHRQHEQHPGVEAHQQHRDQRGRHVAGWLSRLMPRARRRSPSTERRWDSPTHDRGGDVGELAVDHRGEHHGQQVAGPASPAAIGQSSATRPTTTAAATVSIDALKSALIGWPPVRRRPCAAARARSPAPPRPAGSRTSASTSADLGPARSGTAGCRPGSRTRRGWPATNIAAQPRTATRPASGADSATGRLTATRQRGDDRQRQT